MGTFTSGIFDDNRRPDESQVPVVTSVGEPRGEIAKSPEIRGSLELSLPRRTARASGALLEELSELPQLLFVQRPQPGHFAPRLPLDGEYGTGE